MDDATPSFTAAQLLEALGQAVIATDLAGRIVYWNPAAEQLYGWPASEAVGRDITEVTVPHMSQDAATHIMAALREGGTWAGCFPVQHRDGSVFPALVIDAGIEIDHVPVGLVGVSGHLGTALRPLLERSSDAALVMTAEGIVTYASPAVDSLFGWQPEDLVGKSLTTFVDPRDHEELFAILNGSGPPLGTVVELRLQAATGDMTVEAAFTDLRDDPVVHGVVCNLRNSERLARLRERERLSATVHADILQTLFGASLELGAAQLDAANAQARLRSADALINDAVRALRRLLAPDTPVDAPPPGRPSD